MSDLPQVCALMGAEQLLVREAVAELRGRVLGPGAEFNSDDFDLSQTDVSTLIDAAQTLPMMAPRRWVHGFNLHKLPAREHQGLIAYIKAPVPTTVFVLSGEQPDGRLKLTQALRKAGALEVFETPKAASLPQWVKNRAQNHGLSLSPAAASALVTRVGESLGSLAQAVNLLVTYAGTDTDIDVEAVEQIIAMTSEASIFVLTDALSGKNWPRAAVCLKQLMADGVEPLAILALVTRQLRLLLGAKTHRGTSQNLASALGVPPFIATRVQHSASRFETSDLFRHLRSASDCDLAIKQRRATAHATLAAFILEICRPV